MQGIIRFFIFHKPCDLKMVCIFVFFFVFLPKIWGQNIINGL